MYAGLWPSLEGAQLRRHPAARSGSSGRTHRHVGLTAGVHRLGDRVHQVAADAEVTHLDLALGVDEHVGGLHV